MNKKFQLITCGSLLFNLAAVAQQPAVKDSTMNRTVVVEQNYLPEVAEATKINVLPSVEQPAVQKSSVEYAYSAAPASSVPAGKMAVINQERPEKRQPFGSVRAGYGNRGNWDAAATLSFRLSERDRLSLGVLAGGMNGDIPFNPSENLYWDAERFRTQAGLMYSHMFHKVDLNLAGRFDTQRFNYLPDMDIAERQRFLSGDIHLGLVSGEAVENMHFRVETNLQMYRRNLVSSMLHANEYRLKTLVEVEGNISDEHAVSVGVEMNNLMSHHLSGKESDPSENRTLVDLNPAYEFSKGNSLIRLGANVDFAFGGGKTLRVSPDVEARFSFADSYVVFLNAVGGRRVGDFRSLENLNPFITEPVLIDSYELLNASLGFKASPTEGLWFQLSGGYQNVKDDLYSGYMLEEQSGIFEENPQTVRRFTALNSDASNVFGMARLSYAYKQYVDFSAGLEYRNWSTKADNEVLFLCQRPKIKADVQIGIRPIKPLQVQAGYTYLQRAEKFETLEGLEQEKVNNLYLSASFDVLKWLSVYTRMNNLLNERYSITPFVPEQGFNCVVGLRCQF